MPTLQEALPSEELVNALKKHQITHIQLPASVLASLPFVFLPHLKLIAVGGEVCPANTVKTWSKNKRFINLYGPTEATVLTTLFEYINGELPMPIGRSIRNKKTYVLDEHRQPVKPGEIGELYIGGIGIARGYLNRSDITESSFINDPFSTEPAAKLYKTGDLVKYQSDENLLFVGRVDNQVKLNGVRIELEEIETILLSIPQISHAALTLTNNEKGVQQLIAHVVLDNSAITLDQVKLQLSSQLPTYMLPHRLRIIDTMPLTAAGKINRVELEKFKDGEMLQNKTTIELVGQTEKKLAAILQNVLGHAISREDDFFEQGGNSLLATRVVALINKTFNQSFSVNLLFDKPTIADLSNEIGAALAKLKLESSSIDEINPAEHSLSKIFCIENVAIKKVSTQDLIPLSYAQEQLYILQMLYSDSTMYHQSVVISLGNAVKIDALETALNLLIENNDILRTCFQIVNGEPKQVVSEFEPIHLEIKDLNDLPQNLADSQALRLANQLYREPFNLTSDLLIRNLLIKLPNGNFKLYLVMHHIIGDGESLYNLFFPMLESNYIALTTEQNLPVQKHDLQYADYSFWQRQQALDESNLNYWMVRLENVSTLKLHTRNSHSDLTSLEGAQRIFAIPEVLIHGLKKMAGETRSTLYMLIAAVINILLYRYSNQRDICVGTFVSGRNKAELQNIMGDMRNTNILRTDLTGEPTFLELLERVKISVKDMVQHSNFPFQKLVKSSASQRSVTDNPFFQVALSYQPRPTNSSLGWQISNLECEATCAKFALTFDFEEVDNHIVGRIEYRTALFDKNTIEHMIAHLQNIISAVIENPKLKIDVIPILSEFERQQIANWNNTKSDYPQQSIQSIFEQQVEKFPNQTAVVVKEQQLTYSELNIKANQLAHTIRKAYQNATNKSVLPDTFIAVFMERSIELIIALVAILKAGGGYAPIDTDSPTDRIAYIVDDLKVSLLVTETSLTKKLPMLTNVKTLCIDSEKWNNKSVNNLADNNQPNDLAYVMYTSGSTGKPKGVVVTHKNVVRLVKNTNYLNFTTDLYIAQVSNIAFDAATFEIWGALLNGARLVITQKETLLDTHSFAKTLQEQKISTLFLTVALFNQFAKERPAIFQNLDHLLIGGDAVNPATINQVLSHNKNKLKSIINCYGPTENTTFTTYYTVSSSQMAVPIGKPIANTQCYILDERLNYVPIGVAGELYTSGDGLARGYLNLPELTMQRFLNNPFSDSPTNARLYRTGDLARWLPDGNIEFLGRADSQIKIRGHRIEPGEIEFALISHPAVKQAIVTTGVYESRGEKFLIAYFVKDRNHVVDVSDIKNYLNEKLPYYMIPACFIEMESLPITQNGKIDRQKLPIPNPKSIDPNLYVAPRSRLELQLVKLWEQVLEVSPISIHDNFFELGGDSISLMSLNSLVDKECDVKLTFSSLFETPTVAQLAESIQKKHVQQSTKLLVKIQGAGNRQPLFCVPGAGGTVIYLNHLSRNLGKEQPFYAFEARGLENNGAMPFVTVEEMAQSYVKELLEFYDNDSYILAGHSHGGAVCYEIAKTLQSYNKKVSFIFLFDAPVPTLGSDWGKDWDNPKWVEFIALDIENKTGKKLNITYSDLAELSDEAQIDLFHQRLIDNSILSSKSRSGEAKSIIDVTRAADLSFLKYDCGNTILNTKFILFKAKGSFFINDDYGILGKEKTQDPTWGWQRLSSLPIDICMVPGNHNSMLLPPNVEHITDILGKYLSNTN